MRCGKWRVDEDDVRCIFRQVVLAVKHVHSHGRTHGGVRPENVFFGSPLHAFLGDVGLAALFGPATIAGALLAAPQYAGPELIEQNRRHTPTEPLQPSTDVWGLGIVLYVLLTGQQPFSGRDFDEILHARFSLEHARLKSYSIGSKSLLIKLLQRDPKARPDIDAVLADEWLADAQPPPHVEQMNRQAPVVAVRETFEIVEEEKKVEEATLVREPSTKRVKVEKAKQQKRQREEEEQEEEREKVEKQKKEAEKVEKKEEPKKAAVPQETSESLNRLKVTELKEKCKELGLNIGGKKADIIERILIAQQKKK